MDVTITGDRPVRLDDIDLYEPTQYRLGQPHAAMRVLREQAPVTLLPAPDGRKYWSVARHADVSRVLRNSRGFTSEYSTMLDVIDGDPAVGEAVNLTDGHRHGRLRGPMLHIMSQPVVAARADRMRERIRRLVAGLPADEPFDLARAISVLPMITIGDVLGIPDRFWADAVHWSLVSIAPGDPAYSRGAVPDTLREAHMRLFDICARTVHDRDRPLGDDLISGLTTLSIDDEPLTPRDVMVNFYAAVMGANITTPQVVAHLVLLATQQPDLWHYIRRHPESIDATVDEALRWSSPITHLLRRATADTEIGGEAVAAGDLVCSWVASANRDEEVFARPYEFDPTRHPNRHLAFGVGPHFCIGSFAARSGIAMLIEELARTAEGFEAAGPVTHLQSNFINGITALPVVLRRGPGEPDE
jgi:cytochrome P450